MPLVFADATTDGKVIYGHLASRKTVSLLRADISTENLQCPPGLELSSTGECGEGQEEITAFRWAQRLHGGLGAIVPTHSVSAMLSIAHTHSALSPQGTAVTLTTWSVYSLQAK